MRTTLGVFGALACLACAGCIAQPRLASDPALASAPPLAGTLYVIHPSTGANAPPDVEVRHDGLLVQRPSALGTLISRDRPATHISTKILSIDGRRCEPMAISPHGRYVACLRADGVGTVALFRLDHPGATLRETRVRVSVDTHHMAGFTSDERFAVAADDQSCPSYYRTDAHVYSAEPRARLFVIDAASAKTLRTGPCIHGLVTGDDAIVFVSHDSSEEPQYSHDGSHWQPGLVVTLDGSGHALAIDKSNRLVDEQNRMVADDVVDAVWTR